MVDDGTERVSKAVLVTGCSSGIGRATAERLARRGHRVYATARRPESIRDLADLGCEVLALDVTDSNSMARAVETVEEAEGAVGALVNNAGYSQGGAVESVPVDALRRQFETNVFGLAELTRRCLPGMRDQGWGRVVNISSMGGRFTLPGGGAYHASKHAVEALSDALRYEVAGFGVGVSLVEPGIVLTDFAGAHAGTLAEAEGSGPYAEFNAAVRRRQRLRGPPRPHGLEPREGRPGRGAGDHRAPAAVALPGRGGRPRHHPAPQAHAGSRLRPVPPRPVPAPGGSSTASLTAASGGGNNAARSAVRTVVP